MPDRRQPAVKIQTKIYQIIDRRASSNKQNIQVHRRADSNDHISIFLTCTVTTRPPIDDVLFEGDGHSFSNLVMKTARRICECSKSSSVGACGLVERLAADDALHRSVTSQSSCLRTFLIVNRSCLLSLRRRRRDLRLVTMTTAFVRRIT